MTHPEHELYEFKKKVKKGQRIINVVLIICIPVILYILFDLLFEVAGPYAGIAITIVAFSIGGIQTIGNYLDLKRCRYHRFYGSVEELKERLESYFDENNMKYEKDLNYKYKKPYNPTKTDSVNYDLRTFDINIFPFPGHGFSDIRILPKGLLETFVDDIEEQIYDLIKDKRGWEN